MTAPTNAHTSSHPSQPLQPAPYTDSYVEAGGLRFHYLDYGTSGKPVMLCIHGSAAHAHWFDFVASGFTDDYHVLSLDLRGHGESEAVDPPQYHYADYAADVHNVVEALGLRGFALIGHSMGGAVTLFYLAQHPALAAKYVLIDTAVNLSAARIAEMRNVGSRPGRDYATREEVIDRYKLRPGHSQATNDVVRYIAAHSIRQNPDGTWRYKFDRNVYATREPYDGNVLWDKVKIPTLLVRGDHSKRITDEVFENVKKRAPQAELVEVAGSDHHVTLDNPEGFVNAVKPWLARQR
jgi:pimeloyl-ACP methyl ester carboxylesterase